MRTASLVPEEVWQTTRCLVAWKVHWREKRTINEEWSMTIPLLKLKCRTRDKSKLLNIKNDLNTELICSKVWSFAFASPEVPPTPRCSYGAEVGEIETYSYMYIICLYTFFFWIPGFLVWLCGVKDGLRIFILHTEGMERAKWRAVLRADNWRGETAALDEMCAMCAVSSASWISDVQTAAALQKD